MKVFSAEESPNKAEEIFVKMFLDQNAIFYFRSCNKPTELTNYDFAVFQAKKLRGQFLLNYSFGHYKHQPE